QDELTGERFEIAQRRHELAFEPAWHVVDYEQSRAKMACCTEQDLPAKPADRPKWHCELTGFVRVPADLRYGWQLHVIGASWELETVCEGRPGCDQLRPSASRAKRVRDCERSSQMPEAKRVVAVVHEARRAIAELVNHEAQPPQACVVTRAH